MLLESHGWREPDAAGVAGHEAGGAARAVALQPPLPLPQEPSTQLLPEEPPPQEPPPPPPQPQPAAIAPASRTSCRLRPCPSTRRRRRRRPCPSSRPGSRPGCRRRPASAAAAAAKREGQIRKGLASMQTVLRALLKGMVSVFAKSCAGLFRRGRRIAAAAT